jgi:hypothetical protein
MYNTPELLLVGAAQQLVLGDSPMVAGTDLGKCLNDEIEIPDISYRDEAAW